MMMSIAQLMMMPPASTETTTVKLLENPLPAAIAPNASLAASERLEALLVEAEAELAELAPQIEQLAQALEQLQALKQKRQRLLGLKSSLSALLLPTATKPTVVPLQQVQASAEKTQPAGVSNPEKNSPKNKAIKRQLPLLPPSSDGMFLPELAFKQGDTILKRKDSINYEIFRAIVYQGGQATTEQIRQYLVEQGVTVPKTGETFETVTLSEISARVSYLVKHGIARPVGGGCYLSCFGWDQPVQ